MKVLVVGTGSIGMRHLKNLLGLKELMDLRIAAAEPDAVRRSKSADFLGSNVYSCIEQALDDSAYDAVILCSPNHLHVPHAELALSSGCHVFVEKPLARSKKEAVQLLPTAKEAKRFLMVGCNLRFHLGVRIVSKALRDGIIGRPLYAKAHFSHFLPNWRPGTDYRMTYSAKRDQGGGILLDAIHEPDYLCWLFGKAKDVHGRLLNLGELELDAEDAAMFAVSHEDGVVSEVHVDYLRRDKSRGCEVIGTEGTLVWESSGRNPEKVMVKVFNANSNSWNVLSDEPQYDLNMQYVDELMYFLSAIGDGIQPMNDLEESIHMLALLDAVRKSSENRCRVEPVTGA